MTTEMNAPGYEKLAGVLLRAYEQASAGKGKERHASDGVPFEGQPISAINRTLGSIDGLLYQASKKAMESRRLPAGRAQAELLGAIVYLSAAVIAFDTWAAGTLPAGDAVLVVQPDIGGEDDDGWIEWGGGCCPVPVGVIVEYQIRRGDFFCHAAGILKWDHYGLDGDIIRYRIKSMPEAQPGADKGPPWLKAA